jgi:hypothetical protein
VGRKFRGPGAVLLAAGCAALSLTGCRFTAVKDEPVALADVRNAFVVSNGTEHPAVDGAHLRKGEGIRTDRGGTATLLVRGRRVVLGAVTDVTVPDGASVSLGHGSVLVDRRRGPGLTLVAGDTTVADVGEGAVRVERTFIVNVAALSADALVRTTTGPRLRLPALYQVGVSGRALPQRGIPLHLRDDRWERSVIADVVADDVRLNDLADGLDGPGAPSLPEVFTPAAGDRASDLLLPEAIGRAAAPDDRGRAVQRARDLRAEGGSWGVVARLVSTTAVDIGSALADVLRLGPAPLPPSVTASSAPATGGPTPSLTPSPEPSSPGPTHRPSPKPSSPGPTSSSPTSPSVQEILESVIATPPIPIDLLP